MGTVNGGDVLYDIGLVPLVFGQGPDLVYVVGLAVVTMCSVLGGVECPGVEYLCLCMHASV